MPLSINTNIASLTAQRSFISSNASLETAFERLSTGKRINSAVDDAAGLAIGKDLESRVSGLNQAIRNVNDGISMVQITEGALDEVTTILQRMRDLSVQASNGSLSSTERGYLDAEHSKLATTLDSVLDQAKFNDTDLIGSSATTVTIQSGADASETTSIAIDGLSASGLSVAASNLNLAGTAELQTWASGVTAVKIAAETAHGSTAFSVEIDGTSYSLAPVAADTTAGLVAKLNASTDTAVAAFTWATSGDGVVTATADAAGYKAADMKIVLGGTAESFTSATTTNGGYGLEEIDTALDAIASDRASLGATQAQLESTVRNLANVAENTSAAASRIMDTDYAAETANLTKAQILQQAATSVLAQANAQPEGVLALLQ
jgi:flagellin